MKFELDDRKHYAKLMSIVLDQLPSPSDVTVH